MSSVRPPIGPAAHITTAVPTDIIFALSVRQYHEMIRAGILTAADPVELLEGLLVVKMPKNPRHVATTRAAGQAVEQLLHTGWHVRMQDPITLADSEPEPDVAVVRGGPERYENRHPGARDVGLVIEVSDATLERDRRAKVRVYASAKLPVYWIVNLSANRIEVYTGPTGPGPDPTYRRHREYGPGDEVPVAIRGREVGRLAVSDLIPGLRRRDRRGR